MESGKPGAIPLNNKSAAYRDLEVRQNLGQYPRLEGEFRAQCELWQYLRCSRRVEGTFWLSSSSHRRGHQCSAVHQGIMNKVGMGEGRVESLEASLLMEHAVTVVVGSKNDD